MNGLEHLIENNRAWAAGIEQQRPGFFRRLEKQQTPEYMWIGCAGSRVPANEIIGLLPGDVFVHRNAANLAIHSDRNRLSVLQYAATCDAVIAVGGEYGTLSELAFALKMGRPVVGLGTREIRGVEAARDAEDAVERVFSLLEAGSG